MSDLKTNLEQILQEKQSKIKPENIKKDIQIFDITGTLEEGILTSDQLYQAEELTRQISNQNTNSLYYNSGVTTKGDITDVYSIDRVDMTDKLLNMSFTDNNNVEWTISQALKLCPYITLCITKNPLYNGNAPLAFLFSVDKREIVGVDVKFTTSSSAEGMFLLQVSSEFNILNYMTLIENNIILTLDALPFDNIIHYSSNGNIQLFYGNDCKFMVNYHLEV